MSTSVATTRARRPGRGEQGLILMLTLLVLAPMLTFAAFAVDLSSWHARMTHLQESADAAALAGTVWMPNLTKSTQAVNESLARNGIVPGQDDITVVISEGGTATSLRVTVTDNSARRFFSNLLGGGDQRLSRSAEAEYFLPLPLGSPLNYFGGDHTKTQPPDAVTWPIPYNSTSRPPFGPFGCNVGTAAAQGLGRWASAGSYSSTGFSGSIQCLWTAATDSTSATPTTQQPANVPCNRQQSPTSALGRWNTGIVHTYTSGNRFSSGTGNRQCVWAVPGTETPNASSRVPANAPCNVTGNLLEGSWNDVLGLDVYLPLALLPAPLCQWLPLTTPGDNPIEVDRSPGFWAQIEGPGTVTAYGDAFSTRCTTSLYCSSVQSQQHRTTGYWYVIKVPDGATAPITLSIFDALFRRNGSITADTGDYILGSTNTTTNPTFTTEYRVYEQTDPLNINLRTPVDSPSGPLASPNQSDNSCWWAVTDQGQFDMQWRPLCTLEPQGGETFLLNVKSTSSVGQGAGLNGYAVEAIAASGTQPALYAYSDMGMFNNGSGTFYLAEVAPHFAGKVLAIDLWDPGDVSSGTATIYPKMPSAGAPKPVANAPATCTYTASPDPNAVYGGSPAWGATGSLYATAQPSDDATKCAINTAPSGSSQRFNNEWLRIRIQIPADYACTLGLNPETTAGSCWWGIQYAFSAQPYDVTTWKARIEGNPVHLTQ